MAADSFKNLWDIAVTERKNFIKTAVSSENSNQPCESHLLVIGSKDSGKTSMIQRFLERDEPPKPTVGLDFCFGRRSKQNNMTTVKDVTQIWELGGGTSMSNLMDITITTSNIRSLSVVLMLDLSKPEVLWETQHILLTQVKQRLNKMITEASKTNNLIEKELKDKAWERVGKTHADKNMISPLLVPLVIIGSKFDVYQELSDGKKQMISKAVRFLAHVNGGMVQYFSSKAEGLSGRSKSVLSHLAFKTPLSKTLSLDHSKPLIVPFGADSMEQIGAPPVSADHLIRSRGGTPYDLWKEAFASVFPSEKLSNDQQTNPGVDNKFSDELIDSLRTQKDQELERYRKLSEKKAKEEKLNLSLGKMKMKR